MRRGEHDLAPDFFAFQQALEDFLRASFRAHAGVLHGEKFLTSDLRRIQRMAGTHQAREAMREQPLLKKTLAREIREITDGEIDVPFLQPLGDLMRRHRDRADARARRLRTQPLEELR